MWVDSCLFLPTSSSQSNVAPSTECHQDAMQVLFNHSCTTPLSLLGVLQTSARWRPYYSMTSDFATTPSPSSMEHFCQFCTSINLKMHLCSNSFYEARGGRGCNCRHVPSQKSYSFFLLPLLHPDIIGHIILHAWMSLGRVRSFFLREGEILLWGCLRRLSTLP